MSFEDEHGLKEKSKVGKKKVVKILKSKKTVTKTMSQPQVSKMAARIKNKISTKSKNKSQVGFD